MEADTHELVNDGWRRLAIAILYGETDEDPPLRRACLACGAHAVGRLSCSVCGSFALTTVLEAAPNGHSDARPDMDEGERLLALLRDSRTAQEARRARVSAEAEAARLSGGSPARRRGDAAIGVTATGERVM